MKAQYQISEDDYAETARFHAWRHFIARPSTWQLVIGAAVVILLVAGASVRPGFAQFAAVVLAVLVVIFLIQLFVGVPGRARRQYRQYKGIQELITVELSDDELRFSSVDGASIVPWSKVLLWRQSARFILVYKMPIMYHLIPKSLAREGLDIGFLVNRLTERVGPER